MEVRGPVISTAAPTMRADVFRGLSLDEVMAANSFGLTVGRDSRQPLLPSRGNAKEGSRQPANFLACAGSGSAIRRRWSCSRFVLQDFGLGIWPGVLT